MAGERNVPDSKNMPENKNAAGNKNVPGSITAEYPSVSGPVLKLPWEADDAFIKAREKYNANVLMAAYHTVLPDPLPGEEYNVQLAARLLAGTVVYPGEVFSQNATIGPYDESKGFREGPTYIGSVHTKTIGGGVCKIASTLYNVVVLSNLEVVERHAHSMPVPYVPYGQDATVSYGQSDFRFRNNTRQPVLIWSEGIDNMLFIAFYGQNKPPAVEWIHVVIERQKAPTIYRKNLSLPYGTEKQVLEGMDGVAVKSWVTVTNPDKTAYKKYMGISSYKPMTHVIEINE